MPVYWRGPVYICRDNLKEDEWRKKCGEIFEKMYARARILSGAVSGEHGIGYAKKAYFTEQAGENIICLMRGIKQVFDPKGILNPGKIIDME